MTRVIIYDKLAKGEYRCKNRYLKIKKNETLKEKNMQKKVFNTQEEATLWATKARRGATRTGYYLLDGAVWWVRKEKGLQMIRKRLEATDREMWTPSETIRQRMGLDPPGVGTRARLGGSAKSPEKKAASAANGKAGGGRPREGKPWGGEKVRRRMITMSQEANRLAEARGGGNVSLYIEHLILKDCAQWVAPKFAQEGVNHE